MKKTWFKREYIILGVIMVFVFFTMYYYDNQTVFLRVQENMDRIVDGKWYYIFNGWTAIPYGLILQWSSAIWSVPIFILSRVGLISREAVLSRLWYKLFVIIFLVLDVWQLDIMAKRIDLSKDKRKWLCLFFLSSLLVILPTVHIAQMDAVYLFFMLMGINYYLVDDYKSFLFCFMIAIPGKYIPLFIFIPLVLLKEKRYIYIIRDIFVGLILALIDRVFNSIGYRLETYLGIDPLKELVINNTKNENFETILNSNMTAFGTGMSICILGFAILCIYCYIQKSELKNIFAIYVSFIGISVLFAFGISTPYWIVLIMPFMLLLMFKEEKYYNILCPLEAIFTIGYIYVFIIQTSWIFGSYDTFDFLIFSLIPKLAQSNHGHMFDFLRVRDLESFDSAFSAMMVACLVGIMIIVYPLKNCGNKIKENNEIFLKGWYWARIGLAIGWILLNIWVVLLNHVW